VRREEGEILFVGDKYDLAKHPHVETFKIDKKGVFKIGKNFKKKEGIAIQSYGDEKLVVEGDFYKPSLKGSPFYNGEPVPVRFLNSSGVSLNILTGRSSNFQMTPIKSSGEIQEINLQSDFEKTYKFCLVRRETGLAGQKKEYQGDVYSLDVGQEQERRVEIVRTPAGVQVAWIRGKEADLEVLSPVVAGKIYSERERVTGKNWSAWLESRHQFKRGKATDQD